jgi:hypothetical protein
MVFDRFDRTTKEATGARVYCECGGCEIEVKDGTGYEWVSSGAIPVLDFNANVTLSTDSGCRAVLVSEHSDKLLAVSE